MISTKQPAGASLKDYMDVRSNVMDLVDDHHANKITHAELMVKLRELASQHRDVIEIHHDDQNILPKLIQGRVIHGAGV